MLWHLISVFNSKIVSSYLTEMAVKIKFTLITDNSYRPNLALNVAERIHRSLNGPSVGSI